FAGEWQVDETLEELIPAGQVAPIIVVAMDHGSDERIAEYTPWPDPEYKGGGGDEHLQAITDILIPYIDSNYRTLTGPDNTGLAGSSLGGLMALYAGYAQSPTFGRVAGLSPSLWWDGEHLVRHIDKLARPAGLVVYTDMGTLESGTTEDEDKNGIDDDIDRLRRLRDTLLAQGFVLGQNLLITEDEGASHNEAAWRARFPDAVRFLFPPR
ncbi:MAG: alpha/beta hydrolase-fold protein, partial [Myxococcota bacterium]